MNGRAVVVVGGGVIGSAVAYYAARAGSRVTLIDMPRRGRASSASAGGTWPLGESLGLGCGIIFYKTLIKQGAAAEGMLGPEQLPPCFLDFSLKSNEFFPGLAKDLAGLTRIDPEFERTTLLYVMYDDADVRFAKMLLDKFPRDRSLMQWMSREELAAAEPAITRQTEGALRFLSDDQVNPYSFADALRSAARALGATIVSHTEVSGIELAGGRVKAVQTATGTFPCEVAVNAAGSWAPEIGRMVGIEIPVHPVRGQIVGTETLPEVLTACLSTTDCYIAQKKHGEIIIGSTTEEVGYNPDTRPEAIRDLARGAVRCLPFLDAVTVKRVWTGFRPGTPDELPILGPVAGLQGYLNACGHFRTGVLNAPLTGQILAELCADQAPSFPIEPFLLARFAGVPAARPVRRDQVSVTGGAGYSGQRAADDARRGYVTAFLDWLGGQRRDLGAEVASTTDREFVDAFVAGCALVAAADGTIHAAEKQAMLDHFARTPELRDIGYGQIVSAFGGFVQGFEFDAATGQREAMKRVECLKGRPDAARTLIRLCCTVGAADGHFDQGEMRVVRGMCATLGLNPAEFRLGIVEHVAE